MRKLLICALALGGFAASAQAADLSVDSLKDPLPEKIAFAGVTVYGTVDVGYAYQEHGYPVSSSYGNALTYGLNTNDNLGRISTLTNNAMSQSMIGVKVEESLGMGFVALAKAETGFNPISGELADGCKSLIQKAESVAAGKIPAASADSGRCGQFLNGQAYAGLSNSSYGTLTVGRHNSFMTDGVGSYDPNKGSVAFSMIGNSGGAASGIGSTETSRWDNSVKYLYQFGPAHAGVMYSSGGDGTSILGDAVGANIGASYKGLSIDAYYTKENAAVNLDSWSTANRWFNFNISDNEAYSIMGKYTYEIGGGFKDEAPSAKITGFAGYVHIDVGDAGISASYNGSHTLNGYLLGSGSDKYGTSNKIIQTAWVGATYETGPWALTAAYYHLNQNAYNNVATNGGDQNWVSGVVDYKFNKHFDVYSGVTWVDYSGAWANKDITENVSVTTGLRLKF